MVNAISWIHLATELPDNPKIKLLGKMPDGDTLIVIWIFLLCLAGDCNDMGKVYISPEVSYNDETLATVLNRDISVTRLALTTFSNLKMISIDNDGFISINNWGKYQNIDKLDVIREQGRERQRKFRAKQLLASNKQNTEAVTLHQTLHALPEKNRIEKNKIREDGDVTVTLHGGNNGVEEVWKKFIEIFKISISEANYKTWVKNLNPVAIENGVFYIHASSSYECEQLRKINKGLFERLLSQVLETGIEVEFVTEGD